MKTMKDGTQVSDARLARLVQFDARSRNFNVRDVLPTTKPRSYTWRCSTYLDQGSDGACVGFGVSHELAARPKVVKGVTYDSAMSIYHEAQRLDPWPGGAYPGADPWYEGTSVLAGIRVAKRLGYIGVYRWAFSMDDLALAVGHLGPAVLGLTWLDGMFDPAPDGHLWVKGEVAGGHCVLCHGVNFKEGYFKIFNSWGKGWGVNGEAKISFGDMRRLLKMDGEACIPLSRSVQGTMPSHEI